MDSGSALIIPVGTPSLKEQEVCYSFPIVEQYPVDIIANQILRLISVLQGRIHGITVEYQDTKKDSLIYRSFTRVTSQNCTLIFGRYLGEDRTTPSISKIVVPKKQLELFADGSGPILTKYAGNDGQWGIDCEYFIRNCKHTHNPQDGRRISLQYCRKNKAVCETLELVDPVAGVPKSLELKEVFDDFVAELRTIVQSHISTL